MKAPSEIAEEIVSKLRFADNVDQFPDLRSNITAAIQARDEAHAAELDRLARYLNEIISDRDKHQRNLVAEREAHAAEVESLRLSMKFLEESVFNLNKTPRPEEDELRKRAQLLKADLESARKVIGPLSSWLEAYNSTCDYYGSGRADDTLPLMGNFPLLTFGHIRAAAAWLERQGK